MKKFALAGNPNCGKTTLFNSLTGSTAHVGNWPGVTVDKKEGVYKKSKENVSIVDLPGIYSLSPYTPEEVISRKYILEEKPDCVINIVDATNLERNLYLTTQIMEIDVPMVVALNMIDVVEKNGDSLDAKKLEKEIGVPVVVISALKEKGLEELMEKAISTAENSRKGTTVLEGTPIAHLIGDVKIALEGQEVENPLFHAIKLVELDELEVADHKNTVPMIDAFKTTFKDETFGSDFEAIVADSRYKYISCNYSSAYTKKPQEDFVVDYDENDKKAKRKALRKAKYAGLSKSDRADRVLTHRFWGIPIFLLIMFAIFHLTFSENFLGIGFAKSMSEFVTLDGTAFKGVFGEGGINSPGVILQKLMGLLTDTIIGSTNKAMVAGGCAEWSIGLVCDGIFAGLAGVLSFLPQILLLFLFFSILEDSGYMARVAFILDRIFRRFGVSGRAFMPMIMGFGCSVPAMINTRTLADEKERTATVRVIPFFSCGAKLPILTAITGALLPAFGIGNGGAITFGMYMIGIVVAICSLLLMRNTTMKGETPPFIMELPQYRLPQFKSLMLHLWDKLKHFVKKAFTIILASTIAIWFVSHFTWSWQFVSDELMNTSILAGIGQLIQPLFTPLGFGSQLGEWGWVFAVAAISGLIAKENVIAIFAVLAGCIANAGIVPGLVIPAEGFGEIESVVAMISATGISVAGLIAYIVFNMTTIPCFAAVATAKGELPTKKSYRNTLLFWILASYFVSMMIYLIGAWWWTCFIFLALAGISTTFIVLNNKGILKFEDIKSKLKIKKKIKIKK